MPPPARNLASFFSEPLTAILRVRLGRQQIADGQTFRTQVRQLLQNAMTESRTAGYSSQQVQMAVLATVGLLDESVLSLNQPAAVEWARRPLQEELFGGHIAGETFFQNLSLLLREAESQGVADVLELKCECLLLGYKGRYAFGNSGELQGFLRAAQEKIARARGGVPALPLPITLAPALPAPSHDRWGRVLLIAAMALLALALLSWVVYSLGLHSASQRLALLTEGAAWRA